MAADDMVMPMLREMRAEMNKRFDAVELRLGRVETRLDKVEKSQTAFRHALQGIMLSNATTDGEVAAMIERLEERVETLEKKRG
jgi:endonuclease III